MPVKDVNSIVTQGNMRDIGHAKICPENAITERVEIALVYDKNPETCTSSDFWFIHGQDVSITTYEPDEISLDSEDIESDSAFSQVEMTKIEWTKAFEVQAKTGSRLLEFIRNLNFNESRNGKNGQGILDYANGRIHMVTTWYYNEGTPEEYYIREIDRHLFAQVWQNPMSGFTKADTVYSFEFLVTTMPKYELGGNIPNNLGVPTELKPLTLETGTSTVTASNTTISGVAITDEDLLCDALIANPIRVELYGSDGVVLATRNISKTDTTVVFSEDYTTETELYAMFSYGISPKEYMPLGIVTITPVVVI